jgi:hypothetical protein
MTSSECKEPLHPEEFVIEPPCAALKIPAQEALVPTVFHNSWWLQAASGGSYKEIELRSEGKVVARLPYNDRRSFGVFRECHAPELCHLLGPAIAPNTIHSANQLLKNYELMREFISQLSSFSSFHQCFHREISDTLAFEHAGYRTVVDFTFEIAPRAINSIWLDMRDKTRNVIRRAQERWKVAAMEDPHQFQAFYEANLAARGEVNIYGRIGAICDAAIARGQGKILGAFDTKGSPVAAIFFTWDHRTAYYLLSTRSSEADNGAVSLLIWSAISMAAQANLIFDFDGVGPAGNRLLYTGFGGAIKPRYVVSRNALGYRAIKGAIRLLHHD